MCFSEGPGKSTAQSFPVVTFTHTFLQVTGSLILHFAITSLHIYISLRLCFQQKLKLKCHCKLQTMNYRPHKSQPLSCSAAAVLFGAQHAGIQIWFVSLGKNECYGLDLNVPPKTHAFRGGASGSRKLCLYQWIHSMMSSRLTVPLGGRVLWVLWEAHY